jgi:hypothetical protein
MREAEFEVLKGWVFHRNKNHRPQLTIDGHPYAGGLAEVLSRFTDAEPIGLVISGGRVEPQKDTGFEGHAIGYYQQSRQEPALLFNPATGEYVEDKVGDAEQPRALESGLQFEWAKYCSYRIRLLRT